MNPCCEPLHTKYRVVNNNRIIEAMDFHINKCFTTFVQRIYLTNCTNLVSKITLHECLRKHSQDITYLTVQSFNLLVV